MSVSVTVAGTSYTIPTVGDVTWGANVTSWIQAISSNTLQTSGGTFTLTGDLNFGATFGLFSNYITSNTLHPAQTGVLRLANSDGIGFRNSGNSADILLKPDADGILQYNSIDLVNLSATQSLTNKTFDSTSTATGIKLASFTPDGTHTLTAPATTDTIVALAASQTLTNKTIAAGSNTISGLTNTNMSGSAAITNANLASMATLTMKGNNTGGGSTPLDLSVSQVQTLLSIPTNSSPLPINAGGTAQTSVTTAAAASSWAGWDANSNLSANNHIEGYATTATAGATTTLTVASAGQQYFTGSLAQTVKLPVAATLVNGLQFIISNLSSGGVTVQTSGLNTVQAMASNSVLLVTCVNTSGGTGTASWSWTYGPIAATGLPLVNPMTTLGDTVVGGSGGAPARLPVSSTNGELPTADSTATNGIAYHPDQDFKNLLVNGGFDWWQAGTSTTITATGGGTPTATYAYLADQWYANNVLGGGTIEGIITYSQIAGTGPFTGGGTAAFQAKLLITTAPTGTGIQNGCELYQVMDNLTTYGFLYNNTASFGVWVTAFGNVNQIGVQFCYATSEAKPTNFIGSEQTFTVNTSNPTFCFINGQALSNSMTTSGVVGVRIRITGVSSGHAYDLNNGFSAQQAIVNTGTFSMPFIRNGITPQADLINCQRFYEKSYNLTTALATNTTTGVFYIGFGATGGFGAGSAFFKVTKRITPTISYWDVGGTATNFSFFSVAAWAQNNGEGALSSVIAQQNGFVARFSNGSGANQIGAIHWAADARI